MIRQSDTIKHPTEAVGGFTGHLASDCGATFNDMGQEREDRQGNRHHKCFGDATLRAGEGDGLPFEIDAGRGNTAFPQPASRRQGDLKGNAHPRCLVPKCQSALLDLRIGKSWTHFSGGLLTLVIVHRTTFHTSGEATRTMDNFQNLHLLHDRISGQFFIIKIILYIGAPFSKQICMHWTKFVDSKFFQSEKLVNGSKSAEVSLPTIFRNLHVFNKRNNPSSVFILGNDNLANGQSGSVGFGPCRRQRIFDKKAGRLARPEVSLLNSNVPVFRPLPFVNRGHVTTVTIKSDQSKAFPAKSYQTESKCTVVTIRGFKSHPVRLLLVNDFPYAFIGSVLYVASPTTLNKTAVATSMA